MLTKFNNRFMKAMNVKSIAMMVVMTCLMTAQVDAQTKAPQKEAPQKAATAPEVAKSVILPAAVAQQLNATFRFSEEPGVQMFARNAGALEIMGFPYADKLDRMIIDYVSSRPMEPDEYIRFMLPGPVILGDNKKEALHYEASLKLFFQAHPEVRLAAPSGVLAMFDDPNGYMKLVELQVQNGNYIGFSARETAPGPAQIKMD
ncbi:MAG: hypothetical protein ACKO7B_03330 [Flavobacteriales bacterium]